MESKKEYKQDLEDDGQIDVGTVFRNIFCSCDVDNTDLVQVSKIVEFIKPFMVEDLNALEDLRNSLDPEHKDVYVTSEHFYDIIGRWSKKIAAGSMNDDDFHSTNHLLPIDDKHLPYSHSTPRASLGDKLLKCKDLMDLSNISGYSLSTSRLDTTNPADVEKTALEEEIRKLEHQLSKLSDELVITKQQLSSTEEHNEILQQNLDRINKRLHAEQQVIEHLQRDRKYNDELQEEINALKESVDSLKKQLCRSEKDIVYFKNQISDLEEEKSNVDRKCEQISKQYQECVREILDIKNELKTKDQQIAEDQKIYDEMKEENSEKRDLIDQLKQKVDILSMNNASLEKKLKRRPRFYANSGNFINLSNSTTGTQDQSGSPFRSPNFNYQNEYRKSPSGIRKLILLKSTSTPLNNSDSPENLKKPSVSQVNQDGQNDSSEEDLNWKLISVDGKNDDVASNGNSESLHCEMKKADSVRMPNYDTIIFEKDEQITYLEDEIEILRSDLDEVKRERDYLQHQLDMRLENETDSNNKRGDGNGVIFECEHEIVNTADVSDVVKELEITIKNKESEIAELSSKLTNITSLEQEIHKLKGQLEQTNTKLKDSVMKGEQAMAEKLHLEDTLHSLEILQKNSTQCFTELEKRIEIFQEQLKSKDCELEIVKEQSKQEKEALSEQYQKQITENENELQKVIKRKEAETEEFKENLEKKIMSAFEGKMKISVETEEKIFKLSHKCHEQEQELHKLTQEIAVKDRHFIRAEIEISTLQSDIETLQSTISTFESDHLGRMNSITSLVACIEKHIDNKSLVIKELSELNKKLESSLQLSELNIQTKISEILNLKNGLSKDLEIKNKLWGEMDSLRKELSKLKNTHANLVEENEALRIEYNNLLVVHDTESIKTINLENEIRKMSEEKNHFSSICDHLKIQLTEVNEKLQNKQNLSGKINISCQTDTEEINEDPNAILEELEAKLMSEIQRNKIMSEEISEMARTLTESNQELILLKENVASNELEIQNELKRYAQENKVLSDALLTAQNVASENQLQRKMLQTKLDKNNQLIEQYEVHKKDVLEKLTQAECLLRQRERELEQIHSQCVQAVDELKKEQEKTKTNEKLLKQIVILEEENNKLAQKVHDFSSYKTENAKLQKEISENQSRLDQMRLLRTERDKLASDLKQVQNLFSTGQILSNSRQLQFKDLEAKCVVLKESNDQKSDSLKQLQLLLNQNQTELKKAIFERDLLKNELTRVNNQNSQITNLEQELTEKNEELLQVIESNSKLSSELEETRKKLLNSSWSNSEKDSSKARSYNRQQITIDKLRDKVEQLEKKMQKEKMNTKELTAKLSLAESQRLSWNTDCDSGIKTQNSSDSSPHVSEGRTINKFTLCSSKFQATRPTGLDSSFSETVIEVPSLDVHTFINIFPDKHLSEESPSTFNREELEKKIQNIVSVLRINNKDIYERIEKHTEKYHDQYEGIISIIGDISHRLRDHVCIGTAEPIMPVFVLLEEIKIQLKQMVENVGQVGALIYEEKMKKLWNLVGDYVSRVKLDEELASIVNESTSSNTSVKRRKSQLNTEKSDTSVKSPKKRRRYYIPTVKLTVLFLFILAVSVVIILMVHINCRMTVSSSQYCPLDGVITTINDGLPPM